MPLQSTNSVGKFLESFGFPFHALLCNNKVAKVSFIQSESKRLMKLHKLLVAIILLFILNTLQANAQFMPENMITDASFRVEYLLGRQSVGKADDSIPLWGTVYDYNPIYNVPKAIQMPFPNPIQTLSIDFITSQLVLDGMVEITPVPAFSGRLRANASVASSKKEITVANGPTRTGDNDYYQANDHVPLFGSFSADVSPSFWSWEAAGQYNLSYEGGYRFAVVGGYRYEYQSYLSSSGSGQPGYLGSYFRSSIPFIGLQTAMVSPTWKARCEVLGSAFMKKNLSVGARDLTHFLNVDGSMTSGGFIELQVEGNVPVTPNAWLGVYSQFSYEGLKGEVNGTSLDGGGYAYFTAPYAYDCSKFFWFLGLNCNMQF